jgi:TonB family protein
MLLSTPVLSVLASVALRSLALFAVAALVLGALRVQSAAARHAAWSAVLLGMLLMPLLEPVFPPLPIRVLKPVPAAAVALPDLPAVSAPAAAPPQHPVPRPLYSWGDAVAALYFLVALILLARLAVSCLFTRRLLRAAIPIVPTPNRDREGADGPRGAERRPDPLYESTWISVPMTAGRKILLPADWRTWGAAKLDAVLAHERTHVRRADWAFALAAAVNRCVFWFHPLSWWLERRLAALAEEACDDAALLDVPPAPYAQALLDMAAAVKTAQGRLMWEAMAMAKAAEVQKRIERALDESHEIPRPFTARRWTALAACALPVLWFAAVAQLAPAVAQSQGSPSAADTAAEAHIATHPDDIQARVNLILSYYSRNIREPRLGHIYWLIANHAEASQTLFAARGLTPRDSSLNSATDYQRAAGLWRQAAAAHAGDPAVVRNAAEFLTATGQYEEAERLLLQGKTSQPGSGTWDQALGKLYATAILSATGDPAYPNADAAFSDRVTSQLEASEDRPVVMATGSTLIFVARRLQPGETLPPGMMNLDDHPMLAPAVEFGNRLMERMGVRMSVVAGPPVIGGVPGGVPGGVVGGTSGGVLGGIIGSVPSNGAPPPPPPPPPGSTQTNPNVMVGMARKGVSPRVDDVPPAPPVVKRVEPIYPPLAIQARISGVVKTKVTIATDGSVRHLEVASGHPLLVPAAIAALKEWKFQPPAVEGDYRVDIDFNVANLSPAAIASAGNLPADHQGKKIVNATGRSTLNVGASVQASKLVSHIEPVYPEQARAEGIQGTVTLRVTIAENGTVEDVQPVDGNPLLAAAAIDAVKQWTYQQTLLNGQPVRVIANVTVPFKR